MREAEIRDYLRDTERRAHQVEGRLDELHDLQLRTLIRRRSHDSGVAWHTTTTAAGVLLVRREIKRQRSQLWELRAEAEAAREWLDELARQHAQEEAEKERQREDQRRRDEEARAELEAEVEEARQAEAKQRHEAQRLRGELRTQTERVVDLEADLDLERVERAQEARDREGDAQGPDRDDPDGRDDRDDDRER